MCSHYKQNEICQKAYGPPLHIQTYIYTDIYRHIYTIDIYDLINKHTRDYGGEKTFGRERERERERKSERASVFRSECI